MITGWNLRKAVEDDLEDRLLSLKNETAIRFKMKNDSLVEYYKNEETSTWTTDRIVETAIEYVKSLGATLEYNKNNSKLELEGEQVEVYYYYKETKSNVTNNIISRLI